MNPKVASYEAKTETVVAGTTATPSTIKIRLVENQIGGRRKMVSGKAVRVRVVNTGTRTNSTNAVLAAGSDATVITTVSANKELILVETPAASATGTLTLTGVAKAGETVTIGSRVYEFVAGNAASGSNVAVDIEADTTAAEGTLTVDTQPTAGDTMTIGARTYVFVANGTADQPGEISVGADLAGAQTAIVAAINGTDGHNAANASVTASAFATDVCTLTAKIGGTAGNAIVTTETFTAGTNVFDAGTLGTETLGADAAAGDAITALVAAIEGDASAVVSAVDGTGDTVVVTANTAGADGNSIASTETMANASWGAATLAGGADSGNGAFTVTVTNATAESIDLIVSDNVNEDGVPFADLRVPVTHAAP